MKNILSILFVAFFVWVPSVPAQKISAMTETATISTNWLVMVTVPGVTNYKATFLTLVTNIAPLLTEDFSPIVSQTDLNLTSNSVVSTAISLNTNKVDNKDGFVTNLTSRGLKLPAITAARSLYIDGSGNVTNVSGTPDGTKYVRDDGTYAVPTGSVGGGAGSLPANANQFTTNTSLTIKDSALTTNINAAGVVLITGAVFQNSGGTNVNAWFGSNYFGGRIQIASGSPALGDVLTSDADGNASWELPTGGVSTAQLNTASNAVVTLSSNNVRVAAGTGTTVTPAGSGGVQTFTVNATTTGSTQMIAAAIGTLTLTNALSVSILNVGLMNLTNAVGSNVVRMGYQDLTNIIRRQLIYADAGSMVSNSTEGATFSTEETSSPTNRMFDSFLFSGVITNSVQFKLAMPLNWDLSTVKVKLWTSSTNNIATTTNVWAISASAIKANSVITNIAWGTEVTITNAVSSAGGQALLTPATPSLTVGNSPASAGNLVWVRIRRLPGHVDDNDGGVQKLLGAWVQYGETMSEVASW